MKLISRIADHLFPIEAAQQREYQDWAARDFAAPNPPYVKRTVLRRCGIPDAIWVETGTYLGDTTASLAGHARKVYSIEPDPTLFARARDRFSGSPNIEVLSGRSEDVLPGLLSRLSGDVCFWLDGHYSAGITHKGPKDTPILEELAAIEAVQTRFENLCILIDDVRCFDPRQPDFRDYPSKTCLTQWAERLSLDWHIEHDIFIAKRILPNS
jgi:hypothetical protein